MTLTWLESNLTYSLKKVFSTLYMMWGFTTNGSGILARALATPQVTETSLDTIGLREVLALWILGSP